MEINYTYEILLRSNFEIKVNCNKLEFLFNTKIRTPYVSAI